MNMQAIIDMMSKSWRNERSRYHLTLGGLIEELEKADPALPIKFDTGAHPGQADSYRGYYSDLAFAPSSTPLTAGELLKRCRSALGATFQGYKGGDFIMGADTPLWSASYGTSSDGRALMGVESRDGGLVIMTKEVE